MKNFLFYFVLEFAIIFIVGYVGNIIFHVSLAWWNLTITAAVAGAIIAYAQVKLGSKNCCGDKSEPKKPGTPSAA